MGTGTAPRREATTGSQPPRQRKCTRRSAYSTHSLARPGAWPALVGSPAASGGAVISGHESEAPRHVLTCAARPGGAISSIAAGTSTQIRVPRRRLSRRDLRARIVPSSTRFPLFFSLLPLLSPFFYSAFPCIIVDQYFRIRISVYRSLVRMHTY